MPRWRDLPDELDPQVKEFAGQLRRLVDRSGLSIAAVADRTGYSKTSWERYLNGRLLAPKGAIVALAEVTGTNPVHLTTMWELAERAWSRSEMRHDMTMEAIRISQARAALGETGELGEFGALGTNPPPAKGKSGRAGRSATATPGVAGPAGVAPTVPPSGPARGAVPGEGEPSYGGSSAGSYGAASGGGGAGSGASRGGGWGVAASPSDPSGRSRGAGTAGGPGGPGAPGGFGPAGTPQDARPGGSGSSGGGGGKRRLTMFLAGVVGAAVVVATAFFLTSGGDENAADDRPSTPVTSAGSDPDLPPGVECSGNSCTGKDAEVMGCSGELVQTTDSVTVGTTQVEVRYSETCGAAWARITAAAQGDEVRVSVGRTKQAATVETVGDTTAYTPMVAVKDAGDATACVTLAAGGEGCTQ
ncbi:helix-turn-helix domain-containing protein [Streptomyces acidicola]|uniref:helix-turn-helix domain-containing protein n=1 Tax=Streptomyces acidicola TaxID=2596892 RepID=UPI0037B09A6E